MLPAGELSRALTGEPPVDRPRAAGAPSSQ